MLKQGHRNWCGKSLEVMATSLERIEGYPSHAATLVSAVALVVSLGLEEEALSLLKPMTDRFIELAGVKGDD